MAPWQFQYGGRTWRIGFGYDRDVVTNQPRGTSAWLWSHVDGRWRHEPFTGLALLHPTDAGKFSYAEGRKLAVQRLIRNVPVAMRPVLAQAFFGRGGK